MTGAGSGSIRRGRLAGLLVVGLVVASCERVEPSVVGDWTVADEDLTWTMVMREDSTWSMKVGSLEGEGTYSAMEDGGVHLQPTGRMADVMPGGYQATVEGGDTLRLCSIAGCTDMVRVQPD